jgi:hypothetical protein
MSKAKHVYLLSQPSQPAAAPAAYGSLEALALDPENTFHGTTSAIRAARKAAQGWPVVVKGCIIHKLEVRQLAAIRALLTPNNEN